MVKEFIHKGRIRTHIGRLKSFDNLPIKNQNELKEIKSFLEEYLGKPIIANLYGSYYHGFADEFSDYDIIISERGDLKTLDSIIREKLKYNVNVLYYDVKISEIIIP
jgi:predicted nucleotidyltransferase